MRKTISILTMLLLFLGTGVVMAQEAGLTKGETPLDATNIKAGKTVLLKAVADNSTQYFNGGAAKTTTFTYDNAVAIEAGDNGKIVLKRLCDNTYVAQPTGVDVSPITMTSDKAGAAQFTVTKVTSSPGSLESGVEYANTVRLQTTTTGSANTWLNVNSADAAPKWYTGQGNWSVWTVYELTDAKANVRAEMTQAANLLADLEPSLKVGDALITDAATQIKSNAKETSEGSYEALIDGVLTSSNSSNFFHSEWSATTTNDNHDLQFLFKNPDDITTFIIHYSARNGNNCPTAISVYGGNGTTLDNITWETNAQVSLTTADGLGSTSNTTLSTIILNMVEKYNALKFVVTATNGNTKFFTYGEFQIYKGYYAPNVTVDESYVKALRAAYDAVVNTDTPTDEQMSALKSALSTADTAADVTILKEAIDSYANAFDGHEGLPGWYTTEEKATYDAAIQTATTAMNAEDRTAESLEQALAALNAAYDKMDQATLVAYPTDKLFVIGVPSRGYLAYNPEKTDVDKTYSKEFIWVTSDPSTTDANHLWGFIDYNGQHYLYNVGAKLFANATGTGSYGTSWILSEQGSPITLKNTWDDDSALATSGDAFKHALSIKGEDNTQMSVSTSYTGPIISWYSKGDGGIPMTFTASDLAVDADLVEELTTMLKNPELYVAESKLALAEVELNEYQALSDKVGYYVASDLATVEEALTATRTYINNVKEATTADDVPVLNESAATPAAAIDYDDDDDDADALATAQKDAYTAAAGQVDAAKALYATFTARVMPENGKTYTIKSDTQDLSYYIYNDNGELKLTKDYATNVKAKWLCTVNDDGTYSFSNSTSGTTLYLAFRATSEEAFNWTLDATKQNNLGCLPMQGLRDGTAKKFMVVSNAGAWDQGNTTYNKATTSCSSDYIFERTTGIDMAAEADPDASLEPVYLYCIDRASYAFAKMSGSTGGSGVSGTANASDDNTLWKVIPATDVADNAVRFYNVGTGYYIAPLYTSTQTYATSEEDAGVYIQATAADGALTFKLNEGGDYQAMHMDGSGRLVGWGTGSTASHWLLLSAKDLSQLQSNLASQTDMANLIADAKTTLSTLQTSFTNQPTSLGAVGSGLIKDASQFNSNNKETSEGSYAALLDGNASTFFHSNWHGGGEEPHDLQVTFDNSDELTTFAVKYMARAGQGSFLDMPSNISIFGGHKQADGSVVYNTSAFATLTTEDGLANSSGSGTFLIEADAVYDAFRFQVNETSTGRVFFTYGEFQLYEAGETVDMNVNSAITTSLSNAIDAAEAANPSIDGTQYVTKYLNLYYANEAAKQNMELRLLRQAVADARVVLVTVTAKENIPGYLDAEAADTFESIIDEAEAVANYDSSSRSEIAAADAKLSAAVTKYNTSWVCYPTDAYFVITNSRGSIIYDGSKSDALDADTGNEFIYYTTSPDETNEDHLWGFLHNELNDEYYLYNVGSMRFANSTGRGTVKPIYDGDVWMLSDTPSPITMEGLTFPNLRIIGGENTMSISPSYGAPVITYYAAGDAGVPFSFKKSSVEYDPIIADYLAEQLGIPTGISHSQSDALTVKGGHGQLYILAGAATTVRVISVSGITVATTALQSGQQTTIHVPAGIYVVNGQKVIVK